MAREPDLLKALVGVHVLVVDEDPFARDVLGAVLTYCGAFVTVAVTAREALDILQVQAIGVAIADLRLPDDDGYWLIREIRARAGDGRAVPVIALARDRRDSPERTLTAGFQGHIRKPVDPWELCRMVAELARKA